MKNMPRIMANGFIRGSSTTETEPTPNVTKNSIDNKSAKFWTHKQDRILMYLVKKHLNPLSIL